MATPSEKSSGITTMLDDLFGRSSAILNDQCVMDITHDASKFKDALSVKEFTISGLCQTCQEGVFGS